MAENQYLDLIERIAQEKGIDPAILAAMAQQESSFNPNAVGEQTKWGKAQGMMQILPENAEKAGIDPTDPEQALRWAADYVREAQGAGYSTVEDIAKYYHGGPDTKIWGPKTAKHGKDVQALADQFRSGGFGDQPVDFGAAASGAPQGDEPVDFGVADEPVDFGAAAISQSARDLAQTRWGKKIEQQAALGSTEVFPFGAPDTGSLLNPKTIKEVSEQYVNYNRPTASMPSGFPGVSLETPGIPDIPTVKGIPFDNMQGIGDLATNAGIGVINAAPMTINFFKNVIQNPVQGAKDIAHWVGMYGKAGIWAAMSNGPTQVGENDLQRALRAHGIGPEELEKAFLEDPVNTTAGFILPLWKALKGPAPAPRPLGGGPQGGPGRPTPSPGGEAPPMAGRPRGAPPTISQGVSEAPSFEPTHFEAAQAAVKAQMSEGGTPGEAQAVRSIGSKKSVRQPKSAVEAILAEGQLVRPDLTKAQITELYNKSKEAFYRMIAEARAKAHTEALAKGETSPGVGVGITTPQGPFPNSRLQALRDAGAKVERYHLERGQKAGDPYAAAGAENAKTPPAGSTEAPKPKEVPLADDVLDPQPERRSNPDLRQQVVDEVTKLRKNANTTYLEAAEDISRMRQSGEISGARESAMLREAQKQFRADLGVPDAPPDFTGEAASLDQMREPNPAAFNQPPIRPIQGFRPDMTPEQIAAETEARQARGDTPEQIAQAQQRSAQPPAPEPVPQAPPAQTLRPEPSPVASEARGPSRPALDPYLSQLVEEFKESYTPEQLARMVENLGADPADYAHLWGGGGLGPASTGLNILNRAALGAKGLFTRAGKGLVDSFGRMGQGPEAPFAPLDNAILSVLDVYEQVFNQSGGFVSPKGHKLAFLEPDLHEAFVHRAGAVDDAKVVKAQMIDSELGWNRIMDVTDPDTALIGRYFMDQRYQGDIASGGTGGDIPHFTPAERAQVNARLSTDLKFRALMELFDQDMQPEIRQWNYDAGVRTETFTPDARWLPIIEVSPTNLPPNGTWVTVDGGTPFRWNTSQHRHMLGGKGGGKIGPLGKVRARSAQRAGKTGHAGPASVWVVDPAYMFEQTVKDKLLKARHNQFIDEIRKHTVDPANIGTDGKVDFHGRQVPVVSIKLNRPLNPNVVGGVELSSSIKVPKPVADLYNRTMTWGIEPTGQGLPGVRWLNDRATALVLMSPAEATIHTYNVINAVMRQPGVGKTSIGKILAQDPTSVARIAQVMARITEQSGPGLARDVRRLSKVGVVRAAAFGETHRTLFKPIEKIPGGKKVLDTLSLKQNVFDYPSLEPLLGKYGVRGLETRARVAMLRMLDELAPELTDAQKGTIINNELGAYVAELQPYLVQQLKKIPVIGQPFAAAGVTMTKGAFKSLVGSHGLSGQAGKAAGLDLKSRAGHRAAVASAVLLPALLLPLLLNKMTDPQKRWRWEIPKNERPKFFSWRAYQDDGKVVDVPLRLMAPSASRGMSVLGIQDTIDDISQGKATPQSALYNAGRGLANTASHFAIGPLGRFGITGTTGRVPYVTQSGELLQKAEPSIENQTLNNWEAAARGLTFAGEQQELALKPKLDSNLGNWVYRTMVLGGVAPTVGSPVHEQKGRDVRRLNGQVMDLAWKVAEEARKIDDPVKRKAHIDERVEKDFPKEKRAMARYQIYLNIYKRKKSINKSSAMGGR